MTTDSNPYSATEVSPEATVEVPNQVRFPVLLSWTAWATTAIAANFFLTPVPPAKKLAFLHPGWVYSAGVALIWMSVWRGYRRGSDPVDTVLNCKLVHLVTFLVILSCRQWSPVMSHVSWIQVWFSVLFGFYAFREWFVPSLRKWRTTDEPAKTHSHSGTH